MAARCSWAVPVPRAAVRPSPAGRSAGGRLGPPVCTWGPAPVAAGSARRGEGPSSRGAPAPPPQWRGETAGGVTGWPPWGAVPPAGPLKPAEQGRAAAGRSGARGAGSPRPPVWQAGGRPKPVQVPELPSVRAAGVAAQPGPAPRLRAPEPAPEPEPGAGRWAEPGRSPAPGGPDVGPGSAVREREPARGRWAQPLRAPPPPQALPSPREAPRRQPPRPPLVRPGAEPEPPASAPNAGRPGDG